VDRAAKWLLRASALLVAAGLGASLLWAIVTMGLRPLDGVEGEIVFEADRLRHGLDLYVDPAWGAREYGEPPARYLVLYPPVWSWLLSHAPEETTYRFARVAGLLAWLGSFVVVLRKTRAVGALFALFVLSAFTLMLYGASGRPDAIAILLVAVALDRAVRRTAARGEASVDIVSGVLFALAAFVKPNVLGAAPGVFVVAWLLMRKKENWRDAYAWGAAACLLTATFLGALLARYDAGFVHHLLLSTAQPPSLAQWLGQMSSRGPFFAFPLGLAIVVGWRKREDPAVALALGALVTSTVWCIVSLAKIGSASNYFMEPLLCATVVLAWAAPGLPGRLVAAAICVQCAWVDVASVRSSLERIAKDRQAAAAVADARAACSGVTIADEPGLEQMVDGRIVQTPFQSTHLVRAGKLGVADWVADVKHPNVHCVLMQDDLLDRPLDQVDVDHDRFPVELRRALRENYVKKAERGGISRYERR
jgi:hypothetical protein